MNMEAVTNVNSDKHLIEMQLQYMPPEPNF